MLATVILMARNTIEEFLEFFNLSDNANRKQE